MHAYTALGFSSLTVEVYRYAAGMKSILCTLGRHSWISVSHALAIGGREVERLCTRCAAVEFSRED